MPAAKQVRRRCDHTRTGIKRTTLLWSPAADYIVRIELNECAIE